MDKLEVGKWYRHDELEGWIFQFKENQYCKYMDCYDRGLLKGQNQFYKKEYEHYSLLETLTPREALILLAHGFTLSKQYINDNGEHILEAIRLVGNQIHYVDDLSVHGSRRWYSLDGFTIHALPESENG